ncbi:potassium channel family protein [Vibrio sp. SCSIO 43136]|uniref:potassium channel family protein n=1 Tax=Vibrio sp. SCSIO 43136 TaxID=2819101 RepID=UPI0020760486|nr:potassium channel family protein [Vibrio sp. SCSIO 43136]USD63966.1 potassium channel family protein [Vibrio sp. SCSIO 43136]
MIKQSEEHVGPFQLFILFLSIFVLISTVSQLTLPLPDDVAQILLWSDGFICFFFFIDFLVQLKLAPDRWKYFRTWGWIDLLSSIPIGVYPQLGRFVRVIRLFRVIRSMRRVATVYMKNKVKSSFSFVVFVSIMMLTCGAIAILLLEGGITDSNIHNAEDAFWWAFVTITTVGYGDFYPVTAEGRMVAVVLMTSGVGLFGTFTSFVASWFVEDESDDQGKHIIANLRKEVTSLKGDIAELKALIEEQNKDR